MDPFPACPDCKQGHLEPGSLHGEMGLPNAVSFGSSAWRKGTPVQASACRSCGHVALRLARLRR